MVQALKINDRDNCAVVLVDVRKGETVEVRTATGISTLAARCDIASGHKIALVSLAVDEPIVKYGEEIGRTGAAIEAGDWVHLHNVTCRRGHQNQE
ncbi:MAG: UxaA family hydrolase [Syntrophales bacterium]